MCVAYVRANYPAYNAINVAKEMVEDVGGTGDCWAYKGFGYTDDHKCTGSTCAAGTKSGSACTTEADCTPDLWRNGAMYYCTLPTAAPTASPTIPSGDAGCWMVKGDANNDGEGSSEKKLADAPVHTTTKSISCAF